jgi:hypothetical protein
MSGKNYKNIMKNLKTFEDFKSVKPDVNSSKKITISKEDVNLFNDEPVLQKLIADEKVSLIGNEVYYNDEEVKNVLQQYLKIENIKESINNLTEDEDIEGFLTNRISVDLFLDDIISDIHTIILLKSGKVLEKLQNSKSWKTYSSKEEFENKTGASLDREYSGNKSKELLNLFMSVDDYINESIEGVYIDGQFDNPILESILSNYK